MDYITTYMAKSFSLEEPKNITLVLKNVNFSFSGDFLRLLKMINRKFKTSKY